MFAITAPTDAGFQQIARVDTVANHAYGTEVIATDPNLGSGEFIYVAGPAASITGQTVSSITVSAGIATITTGAAHGLKVGDQILISGATPSAFNGTYTILTVPSTTTATFTQTTSLTYTSGATYVATAITVGDMVSLTPTLVGGQVVLTAARWAGTALSGIPLGVAAASFFGGNFGWIQVSGVAIAQVSAAPTVGNSAYFQSTNGVVSSTIVAGKQVNSSMFVSTISVTIGQGSTAQTLSPLQALLAIQRPFAQGAIT